MNEQELRALVREAVERHLRPQGAGAGLKPRATETTAPPYAPQGFVSPVAQGRISPVAQGYISPVAQGFSPVHTSHILLPVIPGSEVDDGTCVIEPAVRCNHCRFCQSYGH